jgi:hypothetical protein
MNIAPSSEVTQAQSKRHGSKNSLIQKVHLIRDMVESRSFTTSQMAAQAGCSKLTIINIRRNLQQSGSLYSPQTRIGWKRTVTQLMIETLCDHLLEKPGLYFDKMAISSGTSSRPWSQPLASDEPLSPNASPKRRLGNVQGSRMPI